jgi:hypothetical protein
MSYLVVSLFSFAFLILVLILRKTAVRKFFEYKYERALHRKQYRQAEIWGKRYYGTLTHNEREENGIKDIKAIVEREIHNYAA